MSEQNESSNKSSPIGEVSRRGFLKGMGIGTAATGVLSAARPDAEAATRELVDAISRVIDLSAKEAKAAHEVTGAAVPVPLQPPAVVTRLGGRIGAVLGTVRGHRYRLGGLEWHGASMYEPAQNWRDSEAALMSRQLDPILRTGVKNGSGNAEAT